MKNILFIIDSFGMGGAEKALINQAKEFHKLNFNIYCVTLYDEIQLEIPSFINLHCLNWKNYKIFKYQRNIKKLYFLINNLKVDFSMILVNLNKSIRLMKEYKHNNIYYIIHTTLSYYDPTLLSNRHKLKKIRNLYENLNLITVSDGIKKDMIQILGIKPKSIRTIYNIIDIDEIILQSKYNIDNLPQNYVVHVGRFHKAKRHDILLQAYKNANIDAKLILVGDGEEKSNILYLIKKLALEDKVILVGFTINPYPIIKHAKLLILTSDYEGFSIVLVEALALGTPVVSTNCHSGPDEILRYEYTKYLAKVNNIESISKKILDVYTYSYHIDNSILNKFNKTIIIKEYLKLMDI